VIHTSLTLTSAKEPPVAAAQLLPASDRALLLMELRTELARRRRALGLSQARLANRMGFDELFSGLVVANDEGVVVTMATPGRPAHGVPFVEERVAQLLGSEPLAPAAAACLALAWRDRETLLGT
jgi:hypothetical protein